MLLVRRNIVKPRRDVRIVRIVIQHARIPLRILLLTIVAIFSRNFPSGDDSIILRLVATVRIAVKVRAVWSLARVDRAAA